MSEIVYCKYCDEMLMAEFPEGSTKEEKERMTIDFCKCDKAKYESERLQEIVRAKARIEELFGEHSEEIGFEPIDSQKIHDLMNEVVEIVSKRLIKSTTIKITNQATAKISIRKGKIDVERTQTTKYKL